MGVIIKSVAGESGRLAPGDEITAINDRRVDDQLDILFNMSSAQNALLSVRDRKGIESSFTAGSDFFEREGVRFREMEFRRCSSNCIFCFVDQMPSGLRETLYCKDDDYRLSFLYGNYVTLNDISEKDINRITEYGLSPLYVSVHSLDRHIREDIFGRPMKNDILDIMERLTSGGITLHTQIVLVPGMNDGAVLERTVKGLARLYPGCASLSIVPVGLTRHRSNLPMVEGFTPEEARNLFGWKERMESSLDLPGEVEQERFFYLSDEFYFLAGRELPDESYYGDFPQIDNGVGLSRKFISNIEEHIREMRGKKLKYDKISVITGELGADLITGYILPIIKSQTQNLDIQLIPVENRLFGREVTVSGLLSGADIIRAASEAGSLNERVVIPPNAVNHRDLLIDSVSVDEISSALGRDVIVPNDNFLEYSVTGL
ncbi:MAG: DUF512 domain-containing protein [Candidatus Latescibacteria bacterium]|nr:DUF512 domain-containing protein [bacterium]MBD3423657.1 DUF512 domain-containing protein [Candidatus Latescibacterota bacterium]